MAVQQLKVRPDPRSRPSAGAYSDARSFPHTGVQGGLPFEPQKAQGVGHE